MIRDMQNSRETERVRFEAREVPVCAEHCAPSELRVGETYFQVSYLDPEGGYVEIFLEEQSSGVYVYERASDALLRCSVHRAAIRPDK